MLTPISSSQLNSVVLLYLTVALICAHQYYFISVVTATNVPIRVNVGGQTVTDPFGNEWEGDELHRYFNSGNFFWACPKSILGTTNDVVYCTYRWFGEPTLPSRYTFPTVTAGQYIIQLHFAELYWHTVNRRVFHIYLDGSLIANNFDVFKEAGSHNKAVVLRTTVNVTHSNGLVLELVRVRDNPAISGIEIIPSGLYFETIPSAPEEPTLAPIIRNQHGQKAIRINSGGEEYIDNNGTFWSSDNYVENFYGQEFSICPHQITGTVDSALYCCHRWFSVANGSPYIYRIPVSVTGSYEVRLHFAEIFFNDARKRIFAINVEGSIVFDNVDVFAQAGGKNAALVLSTPVTVNDTEIFIELLPVLENPFVSAIEVIPLKLSTPAPIMKATSSPTTAPITQRTLSPTNMPLFKTHTPSSKPTVSVNNVPIAVATSKPTFKPTIAPSTTPIRKITSSPTNTPTFKPTVTPTSKPTGLVNNVPIAVATSKPTFNPTIAPSTTPIRKFTSSPTFEPTIAPTYKPTLAPIAQATMIPTSKPTNAPTFQPVSLPTQFQPILINCGGDAYLDNAGVRTWQADIYFKDGFTYSNSIQEIFGTLDDPIYQAERWGEFSYSIPVPAGEYEITIHLVEIFYQNIGERVFDLTIEGKSFYAVDINKIGGGPYKAVTLQSAQIVDDGFLDIVAYKNVTTSVDNPKISAIEIKMLAPHTSHAVAGGPYIGVDTENLGYAIIPVDGTASHTHGPGMILKEFLWSKGRRIIATGGKANLRLPVGEHSVLLTVVDSGGNDSTETFSVSILPFGFPTIFSTIPSNGTIFGNEPITIKGSGFNFTAAQTTVQFGLVTLTGAAIQVVNENTIIVTSPPVVLATPVYVSVVTPIGTSDRVMFTYISSSPIAFESGKLIELQSATVARFGPDRKLYVGTLFGELHKLTLNDDYTAVVGMTTSMVAKYRAIMGIAFDPMDARDPIPPIYITSSFFFHGESKNTFKEAINGKVHRITGANMDIVENIISGLPVSDSDHGVNGIEFGNNGELYIQVGSNTNGGVPGPLTTKQIQKDNYYSAATVVAYLSDPLFNGFITYDAVDDGTPNGGYGIEVFAAGNRNPFGIVMHSNGYLYGTDNGSNLPYGNMMTGCRTGEFIAAVETEDKINLLQKGKYYGQPNAKRADRDNDPRQCVWQDPTTTSDSHNFTIPLIIMKSSTNGIIEYKADSFDGQLRGNLIAAKYTDGLFRIVLTDDGLNVVPQSIPAIPLVGDGGLDVTQAPNGNLIEVRLPHNSLHYQKPVETISEEIKVISVFPTRGSNTGGASLFIYGANLDRGVQFLATVGEKNCPVLKRTKTMVECSLPGGTNGNVDVVVSSSEGTYIFRKGYRYISGIR